MMDQVNEYSEHSTSLFSEIPGENLIQTYAAGIEQTLGCSARPRKPKPFPGRVDSFSRSHLMRG